MNKKKIFKIIFIISFLPYILLMLLAIDAAIYGYDIYTWFGNQYIRTIYGVEAFKEIVIWVGLSMCAIPVLPTALIIQIIYIVLYIKNKRKIRKDME